MVWLSSSYLWCLKAVLTPFWVFFFLPQCSCKGDAPYQEPENMHKKSFHTSKSATSDHVRAYLEETLHPVEWQKLNWSTSCWNSFTKLPHFFLCTRHQRTQWDMEFHWERKGGNQEHCGAIMRADCEVRVGTASAGMSRLARLVLLQRKGLCVGERVHLRIEISCQMSKGYPFVCTRRGGQILRWLFLSVE